MLRLSLILLISCSVFFSCKKNSNGCTRDIYSYEFYNNSKIDTISNYGELFYQINPGGDLANDIVFEYTHKGPECEDWVDEEYTDKLVFKIASTSNSFYIQNDQLEAALCLFRKIAWWTDGATRIRSGYIKGTKVSATKWDIEIDIQINNQGGRLILKKTFTPH